MQKIYLNENSLEECQEFREWYDMFTFRVLQQPPTNEGDRFLRELITQIQESGLQKLEATKFILLSSMQKISTQHEEIQQLKNHGQPD